MTGHDSQDIEDVGAISPRLLRHLRYREGRFKQEIAQQIDQAFRELKGCLTASAGAAQPGGQAAPASEELAAMRRDIKHLQQAVAETNRRIDQLATSVDMRFERVLGYIGDQARKASEPTRARDAQGRLVDPLLTAVEARRRLLGVKQRQVAEILQVHFRAYSKWASGQRIASNPDTRALMQRWLDTTEPDAKEAMALLKDWQ